MCLQGTVWDAYRNACVTPATQPTTTATNPNTLRNPAGPPLPRNITVCHKANCIWPTTLSLVSQDGSTGRYQGANFQGIPATATVQFGGDGSVNFTIEVAKVGYSAPYWSTSPRQSNGVVGRYRPSSGFGPEDVFKATW